MIFLLQWGVPCVLTRPPVYVVQLCHRSGSSSRIFITPPHFPLANIPPSITAIPSPSGIYPPISPSSISHSAAPSSHMQLTLHLSSSYSALICFLQSPWGTVSYTLPIPSFLCISLRGGAQVHTAGLY